MENILSRFTAHLESLGYSKSTQYMLPRCVQEFIAVQHITAPRGITPEQIAGHHEYLQSRPHKRRPGGLSESHIKHHIYALKTFLTWLESGGEIQTNPISGLEFPVPHSPPRAILSPAEIRQLYASCESYRARAILSIYYGCGLRRSEGVKLDLKDVHYRSGLLYVRSGKGGRRRVVPMSRQVQTDLQNYAYRERKAQPGQSAFLTGQRGARLSGFRAAGILKEQLHKAGIGRQITLHSLRHSIATHLLAAGMSVEKVREFLGHRHLESTQRYTHITKQQLHEL